MRVVLQVTSGPSLGRQIPIQAGEIARFGSSDFADVCFPSDEQMSEVHFELRCSLNGCSIRDVTGEGRTLVNDQPISETSFNDGDVILAGQTKLTAMVEGKFYSADNREGIVAGHDAVAEPENAPVLAIEFCEPLDLEEDSLRLLLPAMTTDEFISQLIENGQFADAIRVLSIYLPKRDSIFWGHQSVQLALGANLSKVEQDAMDSVLAFLKDPTEENRRQTHAAAEATQFHSGASWVALSAFWSEGSIAPAGLPEVPPDENLCGQAVSGALMMTATAGDPTRCQERFRKILDLGKEVMQGKLKLSA